MKTPGARAVVREDVELHRVDARARWRARVERQPPTSNDEFTTKPSRGESRSMNGLLTGAAIVTFTVRTTSNIPVMTLRPYTASM
jgi:hypothetical protein